jgi:lipoprotein NlpD
VKNRRLIYLILCILIPLYPGLRPACASSPLNLKGNYNYSKGWYHRVKKGETLGKIAKKYNRSYIQIARLNEIKAGSRLKTGMYIYIPPPEKALEYKSTPRYSSSVNQSKSKKQSGSRQSESKSEKQIKSGRKSSTSASLPNIPKYTEKKKTVSSKKVSSKTKTSSSGFIWPLKGKITKKFSSNKNAPHKGIDITALKGTTIRAAKAGKVIYCDDGIPGYGNLIILEHNRGLSSVYAHNSKMFVKVGDKVRAGSAISKIGNTGLSNGYSLLFEIRKNAIPVNPRNYLPR